MLGRPAEQSTRPSINSIVLTSRIKYYKKDIDNWWPIRNKRISTLNRRNHNFLFLGRRLSDTLCIRRCPVFSHVSPYVIYLNILSSMSMCCHSISINKKIKRFSTLNRMNHFILFIEIHNSYYRYLLGIYRCTYITWSTSGSYLSDISAISIAMVRGRSRYNRLSYNAQSHPAANSGCWALSSNITNSI